MASMTQIVHKKTFICYRNTSDSAGVICANLGRIQRQVGHDQRTQAKDQCFISVLIELLQLLLMGCNDGLGDVQTVREVHDDTGGQR